MQNRVSFIHTGDLHLGSQFTNVPKGEADGIKVLNAGYDTLHDIVDCAIERSVDFVLFAGDIFDNPKTMLLAQARFETEMIRLKQAGISAYIIYGNHDPVTDHPGAYRWPDNVVEFGYQAFERKEHEGKNGTCAIYGRSFGYKAEPASFVIGLKCDRNDANAIGLMHTDLGRENTTSYAPCSVEELLGAGMDYWALGHTHNGGVVNVNDPLIAYCTSPQALDINETGKHGFRYVELTDGKVSRHEFVPSGRITFAGSSADISACEDIVSVADVAGRAIQEMVARDYRSGVVRLTLFGDRRFDSTLWNSLVENELTEMLSSKCEHMGTIEGQSVWLDGTINDKTLPYIHIDELAASNTFFAEMKMHAGAVDLLGFLEDAEIRGALSKLGASLEDYRDIAQEAYAMAARDLVSEGGRS